MKLFSGLWKGVSATAKGIARAAVATAKAARAVWRWAVALDMRMVIRRALKIATIALVLYAIGFLLYPTQYRGWKLWLGEDEVALAKATSIVLVGFNAIILTLVRDAWANKHRGLAIGGGVLGLVLMICVLGGSWNYYTATSSRAVTVSSTATSGAHSSVKEAEKALADHNASAAKSLAVIDKAIADTPVWAPTGRSKLAAQRAEADRAASTERARLEGKLAEARQSDVSTNETRFDPRPIDATMAAWFGVDRALMGSLNDLVRALCFELLAIFGLALALSAATSDIGVVVKPKAEAVAPEAKAEPPPAAEEDDDWGLADLRDEDFKPSDAVADNRRAAAGRKAAQTKRRNEEERAAPRGTGDERLPPEETEVRAEEIVPEPEPEDEIETVEIPEREEAA